MRSRRLLPLDEELSGAGLAADEGEAQELEGLRFALPALLAIGRREAAELDHAGFVRVERQRERLDPRAHRLEEPPGVGLVLEARDHIVRIADDDHVAGSLALSPAFGPQIQPVVQVDVAPSPDH